VRKLTEEVGKLVWFYSKNLLYSINYEECALSGSYFPVEPLFYEVRHSRYVCILLGAYFLEVCVYFLGRLFCFSPTAFLFCIFCHSTDSTQRTAPELHRFIFFFVFGRDFSCASSNGRLTAVNNRPQSLQ